jgi:hypothetical protein
LLDVEVCHKSLVSRVIFKGYRATGITSLSPQIGLVTGTEATDGRLCTAPPYSANLASGDFHLFIPLRKHLTNKRFVTDGDVKQAVTYWPQALGTCAFYIRIQAMVLIWNRHIIVQGDYMESDVYHLLHMYYFHIEEAVKFSASKCVLSYFL